MRLCVSEGQVMALADIVCTERNSAKLSQAIDCLIKILVFIDNEPWYDVWTYIAQKSPSIIGYCMYTYPYICDDEDITDDEVWRELCQTYPNIFKEET